MKAHQNPSLHSIQHWIFDMDGTLTRAIHDFDQIRETLGLPAGRPILESIEQLDPGKAVEVSSQLHDIEMDIASDATQQPGAQDLLTYLSATDKKLAILTRNGKDIALQTLKSCGLDHFFEEQFVISRDCCAPKPEPDGVQRLLQLWNTSPQNTIIVGDYLFDLEAGFRAGIWTLHLDITADFSWPEFMTFGVSELQEITDRLVAHHKTD